LEVYTIGFAKKPAAEFFGVLRKHKIKKLLDVRLNNTSQLAGYTKKADLEYFLKELCGAEYYHELLLAPTLNLLRSYRKHLIRWPQYEEEFIQLLAERRVEEKLDRQLFAGPTVLLCSEPTAERCHRRLVVEYLGGKWGEITPHHL
jgi:uncharacterized protein (DUF488 family)